MKKSLVNRMNRFAGSVGLLMTVCVTASFWLASPARGDVVYLAPEKTSFTLEGDIIEETDEYIVLRMPDESGKVKIPWTRIVKIERDINIDDIPADDYQAFYDSGKNAIKFELWDKAAECFVKCAGKPNIPPDALKHLGDAYEHLGKFKEAVAAWEKYLMEKTDPEVKLHKDEIKKRLQAEERTDDTKKPAVYDGLEKFKWNHEPWSNPASVTIQDVTDAGKVLSLSLGAKSDKDDKAAISLNMSNAGFPRGVDLSNIESIEMMVYVSGEMPINVAIAVLSGPKHEWHESKQFVLKPGEWQPLSFPIARGPKQKQFPWKTQNTGWRFESKLNNPDQIFKIVLLLYNRGRPKMNVHVDKIYFKPKPSGKPDAKNLTKK